MTDQEAQSSVDHESEVVERELEDEKVELQID